MVLLTINAGMDYLQRCDLNSYAREELDEVFSCQITWCLYGLVNVMTFEVIWAIRDFGI